MVAVRRAVALVLTAVLAVAVGGEDAGSRSVTSARCTRPTDGYTARVRWRSRARPRTDRPVAGVRRAGRRVPARDGRRGAARGARRPRHRPPPRPPTRSAARSARSSSRSCSCATARRSSALVPGDRRADTGKVARARRRPARGRRAPGGGRSRRPGSAPVPCRPSRCRARLGGARRAHASSGTRRSGPGRDRTGTSWRCHPPSSCASHADASRTSCSNPIMRRQDPANGGNRCRRPRRSG